MSLKPRSLRRALATLACAGLLPLFAQPPGEPPFGDDGPPRFGGPGGRPGGMGGVQEKQKLVKQFDRDGDKRLNAAERKAALEFLNKQNAGGGRGRRGPGGFGGPGGGFGQNQEPAKPGPKVSPADVKSFGDAPLYSPQAFRTFFLEFENDNWEKELAAFKNTDVEVTAKLIVDGKTYPDVGVSFHGMSSFMMVGEGHKRSLNISVDFVHADQRLGGYRTVELLNSHEDPTFLRTVLSYQVERDYIPAPKANFARVVINGESWGVYVNAQTFNKEFAKDWFDTTKGARWKVPGSPMGQGSLAYLGDDPAAYKRIYDLKSKEEAKSWTDLIRLCKVLNETPSDQLEAALAPLLDVDGALKFLALENTLINNDGYWVRSSDYVIYQDVKGRFHIIPRDSNETFLRPGGPGPGGPGGGGRGGPGGGMMFGPGGMLARQMTQQADVNGDQKISADEFAKLADQWFDRLDTGKTGVVTKDQFVEHFSDLLPAPEGAGPPGNEGPGGGRPGGFRPGMFIAPGMFAALDADQNGSLKRTELKSVFAKWLTQWDTAKTGSLNEESLRTGLSAALPRPEFGGPGGGGPGGMRRGPGGPGMMGGRAQVKGVELDPLVAANDTSKPLISKLLAVPALRQRYLGYVRDIAEKWLDWSKLGPIATQYHALIAEDVKADTRKLDSTEAFLKGLTEDVASEGPGGSAIALKNFADQRRAYLLNLPAVKNASTSAKP